MATKYPNQQKYDAKHTIRQGLKLNKKTDADIIEYLASVPQKQTAIKKALRLLIESEKKPSE